MIELWSLRDEACAERLVNAELQGDLADALLAIEGVEEDVRSEVVSLLEEWGRDVAKCVKGDGVEDSIDALREILVDSLDFRGDSQRYYLEKNSYLSDVVETKCGLPILLSAVWVIVGKYAGLQVEGVGMPGHFIIRVGGDGGQLVDPFRGGEILSVAECKGIYDKLFGHMRPWDSSLLEPVSISAILERVLQNLLNVFTKQKRLAPLYRTVRRLSILRPDVPEWLLNQGQIAEFAGFVDVALSAYQLFVEQFEGVPQSEHAKAKIVLLSQKLNEMN